MKLQYLRWKALSRKNLVNMQQNLVCAGLDATKHISVIAVLFKVGWVNYQIVLKFSKYGNVRILKVHGDATHPFSPNPTSSSCSSLVNPMQCLFWPLSSWFRWTHICQQCFCTGLNLLSGKFSQISMHMWISQSIILIRLHSSTQQVYVIQCLQVYHMNPLSTVCVM